MSEFTFIRTVDPSTVVGKPDVLTVLWPINGEAYVLCANQCVRDQGHACQVPVSRDLPNWVEAATQHGKSWLVLIWGQHQHTLPFCCVSCMFEFVTERMERMGVPPGATRLDLIRAAGTLWMSEHGECPTHGVVSCDHRCSVYDGEVFENGYAPQGAERAREYLMEHSRG